MKKRINSKKALAAARKIINSIQESMAHLSPEGQAARWAAVDAGLDKALAEKENNKIPLRTLKALEKEAGCTGREEH